MNLSRLNQLLKFLEEDPKDPFTLYAVATEYKNIDIKKSKLYFEKLLTDHPDYLPTYYHAAQLYIALELRPQAEDAFERGIALAKAQENSLALRELQNAYNEFLFDE